MESRRFSRSSTERGFTIMEMMVSLTILGITMGAIVDTLLSQRRLFEADLVRTRINQTIRGSLDVMGLSIRQAGENLPFTYPAIEIIDGGGTNADRLIVRRHVLDEVLSVCATLTKNATGSSITTGLPSASAPEPECITGNITQNYNSWRQFRLNNGNAVTAYIFDQATKQGQFIRYTNETSSALGNTMTLSPSSTWVTNYLPASADLYIIEELEFKLDNDGYLEMVQRGLWTNGTPVENHLAHGITGFQIQALWEDGTTKTSIAATDDWSKIRNIQLIITGKDEEGHTDLTRTVTAQFFPRNILSK